MLPGMKRGLDQLFARESRHDRVGVRVAAIRGALGLSKAEFADSIALDRSSLSKIEQGSAGLDIAVGERVAIIYGVGLDFIYRGELGDLPQKIRAQVMANLAAAEMAAGAADKPQPPAH
jgi:transcriptional regulator with XRE-family HTH domain